MSRIDGGLLARYLAGECTPEEQVRMVRWLQESDENREILAGARLAIASGDFGLAPHQKDRLIDRFRVARKREAEEVVNANAGPDLRLVPPDEPRSWFRRRKPGVERSKAPLRLMVLAAVLAGGALTAKLVWSPAPPTPKPTPATAMRTATTPRGQRATLKLPDGTRVTLGVASSLKHPVQFVGGVREVWLEGEAYFEVEHDATQPFLVHAGDVVAQDLGTQFVVRAYADDAHTRVVVREGKVGLRAKAAPPATAPRVIESGQLGRLGANGDLVVERADTAAWFSATNGFLVFRNTPLRDAAEQLERWYDVDVQVVGSAELGMRPLTATFREEPPAEALRVIAAVLNLELEQVGRRYTLRAK